jgi:acetyl-CoA synthetase
MFEMAAKPSDELGAALSWDAARAALSDASGQVLNIAYAAVDRHALGSQPNRAALRCIGSADTQREFSYEQLRGLTQQFSNVLRHLGLGVGDTVFTLLGRVPETYIVALGTVRIGAIFCPLYSVFGPEPIRNRLSAGRARVLVTTRQQYERKVAGLRESLPNLQHVLIVDKDGDLPPSTVALWPLLNAADEGFSRPTTRRETPALLHFTSGTTGRAKGVLHAHDAVVAHFTSARYALGLCPEDVYWCTADPGWVTGTCYGMIAPLVVGATVLVDQQEFDAERWCGILQHYRVNVWYTAPTAIRMMMRLGEQAFRDRDFSRLRLIASVGEPLNAEAVDWGEQVFGTPIHDTWWQTETGAIMIANLAGIQPRKGSMGMPLPGVEAAVVQRGSETGVHKLDVPGQAGELALRGGWPSMFCGYIDEQERYERCFANGWYLTGDIVRRDMDGYFWFVGRADDAIKSAGHLIGPYEVERVLLAHPAVLDAGVIGVPDPLIHEAVKAYVVLKPGVEASEDVRRQLHAHARKSLGPAVAPREIVFRDRLPKTRSGKVMRRVLRARELGLPEGDTSTLDPTV